MACYGTTKEEAFIKSILSTLQIKMPKNKAILVSIQDRLLPDFEPALHKLSEAGYKLYATDKTGAHIAKMGLPVTALHWEETGLKPSLNDTVLSGAIDQLFMFSNTHSRRTQTNYELRRLATDYNIPLITNLQVGSVLADCSSLHAQGKLHLDPLTLKEYYRMERPDGN